MPRFGKGKPMAEQARSLLKKYLNLTSRHTAKQSLSIKGSKTTGNIHSLRTFDKYSSSLKLAGEWAKKHNHVLHLKDITPELAQRYLEDRCVQGIAQKQLDVDRVSLQFITGRNTIDRVYALNQAKKQSRAYTKPQVRMIANAQNPRNSLSTRIAKESGIRAHELLTLRRSGELKPSEHRTWSKERFMGREGVRYVVTGKGGLRREVLLSKQTANELEMHRLKEPVMVSDRGVHYQQHYDISGGNTWSKSFSEASSRVFGWSHGAHGLRHAYAQQRMQELQKLGKDYTQARNIVSQELGHFRGDVVETYLR